MDQNPPPLSETRGHISVFHVRVKCQTSHIKSMNMTEFDGKSGSFTLYIQTNQIIK